MACFDLDYTIIKTLSGKVFPKNKTDWTWLYPCIPNKLKCLWEDGYSIIFFSNQLGITKGKLTMSDFEFKLNSINEQLDFPIVLLASIKEDRTRKPRIGMWKYISKINSVKIDTSESFYVGDMAGRIKTKDFRNDRSDSDRKFSSNIGITFHTPDEFFVNNPIRKWKYNGYQLNHNYKMKKKLNIKYKNKLMILISGYPGSGKSFLAKKFKKYHHCSKDIYGTQMIKQLELLLNDEKSVIVEGLLYNDSQREPYLKLATKYNYKTRYIELLTSKDLSYHMNVYRSLKNKLKPIPMVVYHTYKKYYTEPINEDWDEINKYHPKIHKKINKYYLC